MRRTSTVLSTFCSRFTPQGYRLDWTCSLLRGFDNIPHRVGRGLSSMRLIRFRYSGVKMLEPQSSKPSERQRKPLSASRKLAECLRCLISRHRAIRRGIDQPDEEARLCALLK